VVNQEASKITFTMAYTAHDKGNSTNMTYLNTNYPILTNKNSF